MKYFISLVVLLGISMGMVGCEKSKPTIENPVLKGIFDGETYTSHKGSFSVYLKDIGDRSSYKDEIDSYGIQERFSFSDKKGNFFGITATRESVDVAEDFFEQYLEKNPELRSVAKHKKTPEGLDCLSGLYIQQDPNTGKGQAKLYLIFTKKRMIYDLIITTRPLEKPEQVDTELKYAVERLWSHAVFRDKIELMPELSQYSDVRLQIIAGCAEKAARELELGYLFKHTTSPMITITGKEKENPVVMNIYLLKENKKTLYILEIKAGAADAVKKIKEMYFIVFDRILAEEKFSIEKKMTEQ